MTRHSPLIGSVLVLAFSTPALASYDCSQWSKVSAADAYKMSQSDLEYCINRGWDPPLSWRPDEGRGTAAKASGLGGFSIGTAVQAPDKPPAVRGAPASVSQATMKSALSFPPWAGFPCQLPGGINICGSSSSSASSSSSSSSSTSNTASDTSNAAAACPMASDTSGTFGELTSVSASGSYSLACGAAAPMTTYETTLTSNPTGFAATEYGSYYIWAYQYSGGSYTGGTPVALPAHLCTADANGDMQITADLPPPVAQMISYNANTPYIALRLVDNNPAAATAASSLDPANNAEKFLVIPIQGGVPVVPSGCPSEATYYKTASALTGDISISTPASGGCEGDATACAMANVSIAPTITTSCDSVSIPLSGTYNGISCDGMTQLVMVDRPNMTYPLGSSTRFIEVKDRTALMATTVTGSDLYLPSENIIRLTRSGQSYLFPQGVTLGTSQGQIMAYGPATINTSTGQVVMTAGGEYRDYNGSTLATYPANSAVTPQVDFPWILTAARDVTLPAGYQLLTQPSPYLRAPVTGQ